jgi:RAS guanyl-releasing protein 3
MRQMTVRNQIKNKVVSLGFNNIEPQTLAAQLTYLEWKILRRITFTDYKVYANKNTLQNNPRLERSIQFFNGLSTWIQCMVLSKMTPKQRAEIIHKFLDVARVGFFIRRFVLLISFLFSIYENYKILIHV